MKKNIGIDVGGTTIKSGITDQNGKILYRAQIPTNVNSGFDAIAQNMIKMLEYLLKNSNVSQEEIDTIGIGIPGVAKEDGTIYYCTNLHWINVPLGQIIQKHFPTVKVMIENDATVAAIAEYALGSIKGVKNAIMLTLGTGVGGGIIIDGKKYSGSQQIGSELGHMVIGDNNFYDCNCGCNGCFETYCSATAVIKYAQKLITDGEKSILTEKYTLENIDAKAVFDGYVLKDTVCIKSVDRFLEYFSTAIANLIKIFDPEYIVLGGGMSAAFDLYIGKLEKLVAQKILFKELPISKIIKAELGNDAGIIGAAMLK